MEYHGEEALISLHKHQEHTHFTLATAFLAQFKDGKFDLRALNVFI